jgi:hypothetical protein
MTSATEPVADVRAPVRRSVLLGVAIGVPVAIAAMAITYAIVAIPMYTLAQADPHGLDRPFFRGALFRIALPWVRRSERLSVASSACGTEEADAFRLTEPRSDA